MNEKTERTRMNLVGRTARRYTFTRRCKDREENVWFLVFQCPVCGAVKRPLENPNRHKVFFCNKRHSHQQLSAIAGG